VSTAEVERSAGQGTRRPWIFVQLVFLAAALAAVLLATLVRQSRTALSTVAATESTGCRFLELLAQQLAGLLDPAAELRLVQLVTLVNVEVADVALL
jgi:hypothetical protein